MAQVKGWPERLWNLFDGVLDRTLQNSLTVIDDVTREVRDGNTYHVSHLFTNVANGGKARLFIITNGDQTHLRKKLATELRGVFRVYEGTTVSANGTATTPQTRNRNLPLPPAADFYHGPTVTSVGTQMSVELVPGGDKNQGIGGASDETAVWILIPNTNYMLEFTNDSGGLQDISISIDAFEVPE